MVSHIINDGKYMDILEYEPNEMQRYIKYYNIVKIKTDLIKYHEKGKVIYKKKLYKQYKIKKDIIKRQNWVKFGDALHDKNDITSIGKEIKMEFIKNFNTEKKIEMKNIGNFKRIYKPNINKNIKEISQNKNMFKKSKYSNKFIKNTVLKNPSIFISNLPTYFNIEDLEYKLFNILSKYGKIANLKILTKNDKVRGIGFLDFKSQQDANKFLNTKKYISIDSLIINFEKSKNR